MTTAKKNVPLARKRGKKKKGDIKTLGKEDHVKQNRHCTLQLGNTLLNTAGAERGKKEDIALNRRLFRSAVHAVLRQDARRKKKKSGLLVSKNALLLFHVAFRPTRSALRDKCEYIKNVSRRQRKATSLIPSKAMSKRHKSCVPRTCGTTSQSMLKESGKN